MQSSQQSQNRTEQQSYRLFTPILEHRKIFISPSSNAYGQNKSYQTYRNWSSSQQKQRRNSQCLVASNCKSGRTMKSQHQKQDCDDGQKTFQILLRQSLKRAQQIRNKNHKRRSFSLDQKIKGTQNDKNIFNVKDENNKVSPLQCFNQLEGKKCIITTFIKKNPPIKRNTRVKSKSLQKKDKKQLTIIVDDEQSLETKGLQQPFVAMGSNSKKPLSISQCKFSPEIITINNVSKIAVSTNSCFILANPNHSSFGYQIDNQNNFIRAQKKSKTLAKRAAMLQKQQQQYREQYATNNKIVNFKNNFSTNSQFRQRLNNEGFNGSGQRKNTNKVKKEQSLKISGWEVKGGWDVETGF